jgi:diguanylate cyclase (GGDEF)-like protein
MSFTDKLTHLYNARGFARASQQQLAMLNGPLSRAMLLTIEVAHLKVIEQALGREPAELMLKRTADILRGVFRGAVIGRLGVDRFAVLIPASPSRCAELIAALNDDIDAVNSADPNLYLSLGGKYQLLDPRRSDFIESWIESANRSEKLASSAGGAVICGESNSSSRF